MNDNQADIQWWHAFKEGSREAFDNLFRHYYPILVQYGTKITSDREMVDDCIHDLFIELWHSRSSTEIISIRGYFLKSLKYKIYRHLRNKQPDNSIHLDETGSFELSHDNFIVSREEERSRVDNMIRAVNQLPARQKEIIYLKVYQGLSYEAISDIMDINYQVARNLFYQAVKSLRNKL